MATIASLEDTARGVYCGAVGLLSPPGAGPRARFNVGIRTAVVDHCTGSAEFGSGGGIVWDSDASAEYAELRAKAALLSAQGGFDLLETMRAHPGVDPCHWADHRDRLLASAAHFGFAVSPEALDRAVRRATRRLDAPSVLRLLVTRDGSVSTETATLDEAPGPVRLEIDGEPVDDREPWVFHKTTRRGAYERRAARHPGADQVVLVNGRGEVTETTVANLAVEVGGRWCTPPIESGCLPGVLRGRLVAAGRLTERPITVAELQRANALAVVSSLRGWRPAELRT
jgi:para-aminobenzoate synthetase/4-amino-4-deoxychorismate lyase